MIVIAYYTYKVTYYLELNGNTSLKSSIFLFAFSSLSNKQHSISQVEQPYHKTIEGI